ncbi:hypothetical protein HDU99_010561, partial [Rhizoclosmatium hyalinum]
AKLYYWSCFLITFNVFTCSSYLRLQSYYDLFWVPCFYIGFIAVKLFQPWDVIFSWHTYINAFITATAIFIDKNPKWRIHPTVIVSTAIIGQERDTITAMILANFFMQAIVQTTSPFLVNVPSSLHFVLQAVCAFLPVVLYFEVMNRGVRWLVGTNGNEKKREKWLWFEVKDLHDQIVQERRVECAGKK